MVREYWSVAWESEICEYCRRPIVKGEKVWREVDDTPGFRESFIYCEKCGNERG
jgi:RNase P subunit RPR2